VTVTVHDRIPIGGSHDASGGITPGSIKGWIEKGTQHLNGYKALWFSRSRATTDDYSRMRRQRCMVGALLTQVNPVALRHSRGECGECGAARRAGSAVKPLP